MYLFLIIGHTGQGKTQWLKNFIGEKNQYIFKKSRFSVVVKSRMFAEKMPV